MIKKIGLTEKSGGRRVKEPLKTVGFKLDPRTRKRLEDRAARTGKTPGELARELVIGALSGEEEPLKVKVAALELEVKHLRRGLANTAEALLVVSGKVTKEQAKQWVKDNVE